MGASPSYSRASSITTFIFVARARVGARPKSSRGARGRMGVQDLQGSSMLKSILVARVGTALRTLPVVVAGVATLVI